MSIIVDDESTDQRERQILNILVRVREKALLLESVLLHEPANHANVAAAVNDAIIVHQLRECVFFLITDNTAYCKKAYSDILHKVSIPSFPTFCFRFSETWHHEFKLAKQYLLLLNALFKKQINAGRKIRWVHFERQDAESKSKMPVIANFTRWTSWIKASICHKERLHLYKSFFEAEHDQGHENSNTREILTILGTKYWELKLELAFVSFYGKSISDFIELF